MPARIRDVLGDFEAAHVYAFQLTFALMGLVAPPLAVDVGHPGTGTGGDPQADPREI